MVAAVRVREVHGFLHRFKAGLLSLIRIHAGDAGPLTNTVYRLQEQTDLTAREQDSDAVQAWLRCRSTRNIACMK